MKEIDHPFSIKKSERTAKKRKQKHVMKGSFKCPKGSPNGNTKLAAKGR